MSTAAIDVERLRALLHTIHKTANSHFDSIMNRRDWKTGLDLAATAIAANTFGRIADSASEAMKQLPPPLPMTFEQWRDAQGFPVNSTQERLWRECWETAQANVPRIWRE